MVTYGRSRAPPAATRRQQPAPAARRAPDAEGAEPPVAAYAAAPTALVPRQPGWLDDPFMRPGEQALPAARGRGAAPRAAPGPPPGALAGGAVLRGVSRKAAAVGSCHGLTEAGAPCRCAGAERPAGARFAYCRRHGAKWALRDFKDTVYPFFESDTLFLECCGFASFV